MSIEESVFQRFIKKLPLFLIFLLIPSFSCASVIINEIAWMGTNVSASDEWIELFNDNDFETNIENWTISTKDGSLKIILKGKIPAKGFFILERTDDQALPDIIADFIYKGGLSNNGEYLKLSDSDGILIDEVNCSDGWFAGDNKTKQTMEKTANGWQSSQNPEGTPKAKNSFLKGAEQIAGTPGTRITPVNNIFINEIFPSPEGSDNENEWIELINENNFEADISGWIIKDIFGATKNYIFPVGSKINPYGFLVLKRPETKIVLQNDEEGLELLDPEGEIKDEINYQKALKNQSFNRIENGWFWSKTPTPGIKNIIFQPPKNDFVADNEINKDFLPSSAEISQNTAIKNNFPVFLSAALIAFFSAAIVLFLKNKFKEKK